MKQPLKLLLPVAVLALAGAVSAYLMKTGPEAKKRQPKPVVPVVEVIELEKGSYQVWVPSRGTVAPQTQSALVSEVAGRIIEVSPRFNEGGVFARDDILVQVDPSEYELEVANLSASLEEAQGRFDELAVTESNLQKSLALERQQLELASKQFRRNQSLRKQGTLSQSAAEESEREYLNRRASVQGLQNSLALIPTQRGRLNAELKLKQAQLATARLNLARTSIRAPFDGRVLEKSADLGQSISRGTELAIVYALDHVEIRLPVTEQQALYLELPDVIAGDSVARGPAVSFWSNNNGKRHRWEGYIVRSEGAIDSRTRQQFLVARIENPYTRQPDGEPGLKIGQYLEAEIAGRVLPDVFVLPRSAVRSNDEILLVSENNRISRQQLQVVWRDQQSVVVAKGIQVGDRISLTSLPYTPDGAQVQVKGEQAISKHKPDGAQDAGSG